MFSATLLVNLDRTVWKDALSAGVPHGLLELPSQQLPLKTKLEAGHPWYNLCLAPSATTSCLFSGFAAYHSV